MILSSLSLCKIHFALLEFEKTKNSTSYGTTPIMNFALATGSDYHCCSSHSLSDL